MKSVKGFLLTSNINTYMEVMANREVGKTAGYTKVKHCSHCNKTTTNMLLLDHNIKFCPFCGGKLQ